MTLHPPQQMHPVIVPDRPWESGMIYAWSNVVQIGDMVHLYYFCHSNDTLSSGAYGPGTQINLSMGFICVAVSEDGEHFTKPELMINPYRGSKATNIVLPVGGDEYFAACNCTFELDGGVFFDRREGIPPGERWKAVTTSSLLSNGTDLGTALYGSADGLRFSLLESATAQDMKNLA